MSAIASIRAREVLDSRGVPTVEAEVQTAAGYRARAMVPSGASTGSAEAWELRDEDGQRYFGRGVLQAVRNVHERIAPLLCGRELAGQDMLDRLMIELDGTGSKRDLGANAILAVSLALARAAAAQRQMPLYQHLGGADAYVMPVPMMNLINGGAHADNNIDLQEFMILPVGAGSLREAVRYGAEIFHALRLALRQRALGTAVGDEGGFAPELRGNEQAIEVLLEAIAQAGFQAGDDILLGLDVAASELYRDGRYHLASEGRTLDAEGFLRYLLPWFDRYPIITMEDAMAEDDWDGWQLLTEALGNRVQLVGDDLFVTNTTLLEKGAALGAANSILIKLNQVGTLSETLETIAAARRHGYTVVISHRSGETEDSTIADLAVATGAGQIKTGALARSERVAKYNRLMRIEEQLGAAARYPGRDVFGRFFQDAA